MEPREKMIKAQDVLSGIMTQLDISIETSGNNNYSLIFFRDRTGKHIVPISRQAISAT